jgi:phosphopantetheinyl transferase
MALCKHCNQREAKPKSRKGYCAECQAAAIDGWHKKIQETNAKREAQRQRLQKIVQEVEAAAELFTFKESDLKQTLSGVIIKPATSDIAMHLKKHGYPIQRVPSGGMRLLAPSDIPVTKTWAWALGYAKSLTDHGYNAKADIVEMKERDAWTKRD